MKSRRAFVMRPTWIPATRTERHFQSRQLMFSAKNWVTNFKSTLKKTQNHVLQLFKIWTQLIILVRKNCDAVTRLEKANFNFRFKKTRLRQKSTSARTCFKFNKKTKIFFALANKMNHLTCDWNSMTVKLKQGTWNSRNARSCLCSICKSGNRHFLSAGTFLGLIRNWSNWRARFSFFFIFRIMWKMILFGIMIIDLISNYNLL